MSSARRLAESAIRYGREVGHATTIANTQHYGSLIEACRDDPAAPDRAAESLLTTAREHDMAFLAGTGLAHLSWARGRLRDPEVGARNFQEALAAFLEPGNRYAAPWFQGLLADLQGRAGQPASALSSVEAGLALAEESWERCANASLLRRKGDILLTSAPPDASPAEGAYRAAIVIA
jgi:predicted ATPase